MTRGQLDSHHGNTAMTNGKPPSSFWGGFWQGFWGLLTRVVDGSVPRLLLVLTGGVLAISGGILLVASLLPKGTTFTVYSKGGYFIFESVSGPRSDYALVLPAQGWRLAGIQVKVGDSIRIAASGSVQ